MNINDFEMIARLLKERSGLTLTKDKAYLLESRLSPVARKWGFKGFDDLCLAIRGGRDEALLKDVTEAMTTNESFFFRDTKPFDQFRDLVLPSLLSSRGASKQIRIWSAACSNGQEPYSLAMILQEASAKLTGWRIEILATDLSTEVLQRGRDGVYTQFEVQRGLPITYLVKYFGKNGDRWRINEKIRSMVKFQPFNLLQSMSALGRFDVIFCRNVLIYFDQPTKTLVLDRIAGQMSENGFLFLGGAETVVGTSLRFQPMQGHRGVYTLATNTATAKKVG
ncbi:MAG: CheR family methyltransferase [Kiloniellales bacterium]